MSAALGAAVGGHSGVAGGQREQDRESPQGQMTGRPAGAQTFIFKVAAGGSSQEAENKK